MFIAVNSVADWYVRVISDKSAADAISGVEKYLDEKGATEDERNIFVGPIEFGKPLHDEDLTSAS